MLLQRIVQTAVAGLCVVAATAVFAAEGVEPAVLSPETIDIKSAAAAVYDETEGKLLYGKNAEAVVPIASITKLMTAMVVLDADQDLDEPLTISNQEIQLTRIATLRTPLVRGVTLTRNDLLHLALMASDNRAAAALAVNYPGGLEAFLEAANAKAKLLDMNDSHFADPTGLNPANVSTAVDLIKLVRAAHEYPLIREYSTSPQYEVTIKGRRHVFGSTNGLVRADDWNIGLQKTGFIRPAGRCLVMYMQLATGPVIVVLLDSIGMYTRLVDAARIRQWLEPGYTPPIGLTRAAERVTRPKARHVAPKSAPKPAARPEIKPATKNVISRLDDHRRDAHRSEPQRANAAARTPLAVAVN